MRLELLAPLGIGAEASGAEIKRDIGAIVVRGKPAGGVVLEVGPADGPPHLRLALSTEGAARLGTILQAVAGGGGEAILLADP